MHYSEAPRLEQPEEKPKRPQKYEEEVAYVIIEQIGDGKSLHEACAPPGMPHPVTFYRWLGENEEFARAYHYALLARFDKAAHELVAIVDDASQDYIVESDAEGVPKRKLFAEALERTRDRIKLRQWIMQKELPRKYADSPPTVAAASPKQLENQPSPHDETVYLARQSIEQLLATRAITPRIE